MNLLIIIAIGIGFFALAGLALNLLVFVGIALWQIPYSFYQRYKDAQNKKKRDALIGHILQTVNNAIAKDNQKKAYDSAVSEVSTKKKATKKATKK